MKLTKKVTVVETTQHEVELDIQLPHFCKDSQRNRYYCLTGESNALELYYSAEGPMAYHAKYNYENSSKIAASCEAISRDEFYNAYNQYLASVTGFISSVEDAVNQALEENQGATVPALHESSFLIDPFTQSTMQ